MTDQQLTLPTVEAAEINPLSIIQSAIQSGIGADELSKLMDLQERWEANNARKAFADALARFQAHCPTIMKSAKADRYSYAPLDEVLRTIRPHLEACGLAVRFSTKTEGPIITAFCTVSHKDGHAETSEFSAPIDPAMKVNETQKVGSANSYAKRYALMNALNLVASAEDDDGYSAGTQYISDEQAAQLRDWIEALEIDELAFLKYLAVDEIESIPAAKWMAAKKAIDRKRRAAK